MLLVTSHEAAGVAAPAREGFLDQFTCLRHGSQGEEVRLLRQHLQMRASTHFDAATQKALSSRQQSQLGFATGSLSHKMAGKLNLDIFVVAERMAAE